MSLTKIIITDENNNEYYPTTSSDIVYMGDGSTLEDKMTNHTHSQYLTQVPNTLNRTVFEGGGGIIGLKPVTIGEAFFLEFFKDKVNRSAYVGYGNSGSDEFRIYNALSGADINFVTTGTGKVRINNNTIYHEGNKPNVIDIGAAPQNHTHTDSTTTTSGFMSSTDKTKLDSIEANANNYIHPSGSGNNHIPAGGTVGQILVNSANGEVVWANQIVVIDNRTSTSTTDALSANQGKLLNDRIDTLETHIGGINTLLEQTINEINTVL